MPPLAQAAIAETHASRSTILVMLMFAMSVMSYFDRTIMGIAGPGIMKEFHISPTEMGTVYSAFILAYSLFMAPGGWLVDRFGGRLVLGIASIGAALFTGMTALCSAVISFWIVRLAFGACTAPLYPACGRLTANWFPPNRCAWVQAIALSGAAFGGALAPIVFSRMIAAYGWRLSFWLAGAATAALVAIWFVYVRDRASRGAVDDIGSASKSNWRRLLTNRNLVLLTLGYFCLDYFEYIFFYWMYYYFGEIRHMGSSESAVYTTILMLTMGVTLPLGGWVSDWLVARYGRNAGRRIVPIVAMTASAVLLYLGAGGFGTATTIAFLSLALGFSACAEGPFWASAMEVGGKQVGAAGGILNTGGNVGGIFAPIVTPFIASRFGWHWGLYFGSFIVILGVLTWFFVDPAKRDPVLTLEN